MCAPGAIWSVRMRTGSPLFLGLWILPYSWGPAPVMCYRQTCWCLAQLRPTRNSRRDCSRGWWGTRPWGWWCPWRTPPASSATFTWGLAGSRILLSNVDPGIANSISTGLHYDLQELDALLGETLLEDVGWHDVALQWDDPKHHHSMEEFCLSHHRDTWCFHSTQMTVPAHFWWISLCCDTCGSLSWPVLHYNRRRSSYKHKFFSIPQTW